MKVLPQKGQLLLEALNGLELTKEESEYYKFLVDISMLEDLSQIDSDFLVYHVRESIKIRKKTIWGEFYSDHLFKHFVLPWRVNNENFENNRLALHLRVFERLNYDNIEQAALEINHFCHEEVIYTSTDIRTTSPLNLLRSSLGRCGEQSTLLVALLRSCAIPSRQCYVPLWAHSDSNHAWVEFYNGKEWLYMGACEPEKSANKGWFSIPATRAPIIQTRVLGHYDGEDTLNFKSNFTQINITENYSQTCDLSLRVLYEGDALAHASVEFCVINYGFVSPVLIKETDKDGCVKHIKLGRGDIIIRIIKDRLENIKIINLDKECLSLDIYMEIRDDEQMHSLHFQPCPPRSLELTPNHLEMDNYENRMNFGTYKYELKQKMFRRNYVIKKLTELVPIDEKDAKTFFTLAGENIACIYQCLVNNIDTFGNDLISFYKIISEKDFLTLTESDIINFLSYALEYKDRYTYEIWLHYVLNPRVDFEQIKFYKAELLKTGSFNSVDEILSYAESTLRQIDHTEFFYYRTSLSPIDSLKLKEVDKMSYKVFIVALLRSFGYASRLNPKTLELELYKEEGWLVLISETSIQDTESLAYLTISNKSDIDTTDVLTLSKRIAHTYQNLEFTREDILKFNSFALSSGTYILCHSRRNADDSVDSHYYQLNLESSKTKELVLSKLEEKPLEEISIPIEIKDPHINVDCIFLLHLEKLDEPSYHIINDINNSDNFNSIPLYVWIEQKDEFSRYITRFSHIKFHGFVDKATAIYIQSLLKSNYVFPKLQLIFENNIVFEHSGYSRDVLHKMLPILNKIKNNIYVRR